MSRISILPYLLAVMLAMSACTSGNEQQSQVTLGSAPATSGEYGTRIGGLVVKGKDIDVQVDIKHDSSLMRSFAYGAYVNDPATPKSKAAFIGSGSAADMIRPVSFSADADYPEMLSGYLAHIDPGGQTTTIDFYEDGHGCETDVATRRGKDGALRTYLVDSTGWVDNMLDEAGKKPERHCARSQ